MGQRVRIKDCPECVEWIYDKPMLVEACASVGLSNGRSTGDMFVEFVSRYHNRGHREVDRDEVAG